MYINKVKFVNKDEWGLIRFYRSYGIWPFRKTLPRIIQKDANKTHWQEGMDRILKKTKVVEIALDSSIGWPPRDGYVNEITYKFYKHPNTRNQHNILWMHSHRIREIKMDSAGITFKCVR